jgi:hypothetical protein
MSKGNDKKGDDKLFVDYVSQDKDWRGVIDNELRCQNSWHKVWGFLADDTGKLLMFINFNFVSF